MTSDCQHRSDLDGSERIPALHACLGRPHHCPLWQAVHKEMWQGICVERRYQYLPDDGAQTRQQLARLMARVQSSLQTGDLSEELLDLLPNRMVTEDLMAGLRQRDQVAARANCLWLAAWSMRKCGHWPKPAGEHQALTDAREAIVGTHLSDSERDLVLAIASWVEFKVYKAVDAGTITESFDGWRKRALYTTKIDELRRRSSADPHLPSADGQHATTRTTFTFTDLARQEREGREGLLPLEVTRLPTDDLSPEEEIMAHERRVLVSEIRPALFRAIAAYSHQTWRDVREAEAKARIICERLLERRHFGELAKSELAQRYGLSAHAINLMVLRAQARLAHDPALQQLRTRLSDREDPPEAPDPAGATP